ncbi:acyl-CoA synthetase [Rhodococcus opacus]|uniref:acyl-CoA synthetase n=1 Tax=Rhodococcus opacus TaxID=37919 RepID=UPI0024B88768|nr:AMP-binding protein [Rhodococcus opacus]MDJ0419880.1 AMP-binding protein [Rhodococcus opacus]MDV6245261.1 AMP-binding protein [Rhodococcus opacus]
MHIPSRRVTELLAERRATPKQVWEAAENRLAKHPSLGLNTAYEACDRWADDPGRLAIIVRHSPDTPSQRWAYTDLARASSRLATALAAKGIRRGDRVAALLPQGIEAYIAALAIWRMGAIVVPLYPGFGVDGIAQRIGAAEPMAVIVDRSSAATLDSALSCSSALDPVIIEVAEPGTEAAAPDKIPHALSFWDLIDTSSADTPLVNTAAHETATLLYTSGTTGIPKGCLLPHSYLLTMQPFVRHSFALGNSDLFTSTSSPGWVNGLYSAGMCVTAEGRPRVIYTGRFDAQSWLDILRQENVSYLSSAPSAMRQLIPLSEQQGLPPSLRAAASAGEHLGAALAGAWADLCPEPLQETYGTTEIGLVMATPAFDQSPHALGALPAPVPGFEIALMDDHGDVQENEGIIAVRNIGYVGCTGYSNAPEQWAKRWRGDWYLTGDMAIRDDTGQLWFKGRDDDLIVTSGYNVGPTEVEAAITLHPQVRDVAVVAAPDPDRGSVVRAVIVAETNSDQSQLAAEVKELVRTRLGRHVYPRIIDFVAELPRNQAGKVQRNILRDTYDPQAEPAPAI